MGPTLKLRRLKEVGSRTRAKRLTPAYRQASLGDTWQAGERGSRKAGSKSEWLNALVFNMSNRR